MEEIHLAHDRKGIGSPFVHQHSQPRATRPFDPVSANGSSVITTAFTAFGRLRAPLYPLPEAFLREVSRARSARLGRGLSAHELSATLPTTYVAARCWHGGFARDDRVSVIIDRRSTPVTRGTPLQIICSRALSVSTSHVQAVPNGTWQGGCVSRPGSSTPL